MLASPLPRLGSHPDSAPTRDVEPAPGATCAGCAPGDLPRDRLVDAWVADRLGRLDAATARSLTDQCPDWRARAATLIAEGLLAYVALEMVAPDLAIAAVSAGNDGRHDTDDEVLSARLGAHLRDFIDYREMLPAPGPIPPCTLHHDPPTGPPTGPAS